jgi:endonuclease G
MNKLICCIAIVITFASCSKKSTPSPENPSNGGNKIPPTPYTIKEDFEIGAKASYALGDADLKTGSWSFDDALLGKLTTDVKNGVQSVRLRTGQIAMNFDIDSLKMMKISHAQYGNDGVSQFTIWGSTDLGKTYSQIGGTINNSGQTFAVDSFKFDTYQKIRFQIRKIGSARMNIDDVIFVGAGNPHITINTGNDNPPDTGGATTGGNDPGRGAPSGTGSDVPSTTGDNSNLLFGNPSSATTDVIMKDNYLIDLKYYLQYYSSTTATPNWVSWHLDDTSVGSTPRQDNFASFTSLPTDFYHVQNFSFSGSGFDRGHNCPSADRTSSVEANSSTFLMVNMIPQAPNNNQQTWGNFENYLRSEMQKGNEVYIIMGSYGTGGTGSKGAFNTIDNGHVTVPSNVWKVAVILTKGNGDLGRVDANTRIIAIDTPNINTINADWTKYIVSINDIEKATKYDLLSALPVSLQTTIKAKKYTP